MPMYLLFLYMKKLSDENNQYIYIYIYKKYFANAYPYFFFY